MLDQSAAGGSSNAGTALGAVTVVAAVILVIMRLYTRHFTKAGMWWDDWFIVVAIISAITTVALLFWAAVIYQDGEFEGSNADPARLYTSNDTLHLKLSFVALVLYFTIASATKLSICLMYLRLFSVSARLRYQIVATSVLVMAFWISCTVATMTNCVPMKWSWVNSLQDARYCFNFNIFWMIAGVCEAIIDAVIILLPVKAVLGLHLSTRRKVTVAIVFLLGAFVLVTGTIKVVLGYIPGSRVPSYVRTELWTVVHVGMAIICACLPVCWPLFVRILRAIRRLRHKALRTEHISLVVNVPSSDTKCVHIVSELEDPSRLPGLDIESGGTGTPVRSTTG